MKVVTRLNGKVKWFNRAKGPGFIVGEDGIEYFVHYRYILGSGYTVLYKDERVTFLPTDWGKGPAAKDVRK